MRRSTNIPTHYPNSCTSEASNPNPKENYSSVITKKGIQKVLKIDPNYNNTNSYFDQPRVNQSIRPRDNCHINQSWQPITTNVFRLSHYQTYSQLLSTLYNALVQSTLLF